MDTHTHIRLTIKSLKAKPITRSRSIWIWQFRPYLLFSFKTARPTHPPEKSLGSVLVGSETEKTDVCLHSLLSASPTNLSSRLLALLSAASRAVETLAGLKPHVSRVTLGEGRDLQRRVCVWFTGLFFFFFGNETVTFKQSSWILKKKTYTEGVNVAVALPKTIQD